MAHEVKTVLTVLYRENPFVARIFLKGLVRYARASKWRIETLSYDGTPRQKRKVVEMLRYLRPDGVISSCHERLVDGTLAKIPHVWMDAPAAQIPAKDSLVWHDGAGTGTLAAKELLQLGLRQLAVVGDHPARTWSRNRVKEFCRQSRSQGIEPAVLELRTPAVDKAKSMKTIEPWLKTLPKPCGVFAVNDLIATEVASVANRVGLRIPREIAIVGVDNDEDLCLLTTPTLTSIATDWERGGFLAGETLDRIMRGDSGGPFRVSFGELGVIRRASTSPSVSRVDPRVVEASSYIRVHACEGIGVDDVVRRMGCSRRLAMKEYLAATGRSIFAEIREAQLAQVLVLLAQRDIQLGAIADRCGWKSPTALRTYFEKRLGMTMRDWRARNAAS